MSSRPNLSLDWCSYQAAKYAVEHWHYSRSMPVGKTSRIGVWEDGVFVGAIVFGVGSGGATDGKRWGLLPAFDVAELVRVALRAHSYPVSKMLKVAMNLLRRQSPNLKLLLSYADPYQGHHGGIYQAANWLYMGRSTRMKFLRTPDGRLHHDRSWSATGVKKHYGRLARCLTPADGVVLEMEGKHVYVWPLTNILREQLLPKAQPYPKRQMHSGDAASVLEVEGGSIPTLALQQGLSH